MTQRQVHQQICLETHGLACGRGGVVLIRDLTIAVRAGEGLVLRGANGVGKSTLLSTLAGLLAPLAGTVDYAGHDPEDEPIIHYCGHRNAVRPRLSVVQTLQFWADINGATGWTVEAALDRVGLGRQARLDAGYLSAGQQRRLVLARLLVTLRPVWLLDEPGAALDADGQVLLTQLLTEHLADGGIAVLAAHDEVAVPGLSTVLLEGAA